MKTRIYGSELEELAIEVDYPHSFQMNGSSYVERVYDTDPFIGRGFYKEIFFDGVHIGYGDFDLANPTMVYFDSEMETIEMHFALSGFATGQSDSFADGVTFASNEHNLLYASEFKGSIEWSSRKNMKVFEINLWPSFFEKYLPDGKLFDLFRDNIQSKKSAILSPHNYPITPQMMKLIYQIIHCGRTGHFKRMFLESQVIELLMLQLEQIATHDCTVFCQSNGRHAGKLYKAREILANELNGNFTLHSLAQQVGTNEFTLKKGFKELFGITVFGYWNQLKMEEAQKLLAEGSHNVSEVSLIVGYKNPQHFSTAFKRYFGYKPSEIKL